MLHVAAHIKAISGTSLKTNVRENACKQSLLIKIINISIVFINIDPVGIARYGPKIENIYIRGQNDQLTPEEGKIFRC
jgi:hypothetical protein